MLFYPYFKALHVIFVITWFAGLFYVVRLFVYQIEAQAKTNADERRILTRQLALMTKRLWVIITWPSMILATSFAVILLFLNPTILSQDWMHIKLAFVGVLIIYHLYCHRIYKNLQLGNLKYSSKFMRLFNEVPTLILFSVIFLVMLRDSFNWIYGVIGLFLLALLLTAGFKWYQHHRQHSNN